MDVASQATSCIQLECFNSALPSYAMFEFVSDIRNAKATATAAVKLQKEKESKKFWGPNFDFRWIMFSLSSSSFYLCDICQMIYVSRQCWRRESLN